MRYLPFSCDFFYLTHGEFTFNEDEYTLKIVDKPGTVVKQLDKKLDFNLNYGSKHCPIVHEIREAGEGIG